MAHVKGGLALAAAAVVLIGSGGVGLAYWHAAGTGTGSVTTGTTTAVSLIPGTPAVTLYPGGQSDVSLIVDNPNSTTVTVSSLSLDTAQGTGGFAVDAAHSACDMSALSFTTQTNAGAGWAVPARSGTVDGTLSVTLSNSLAMAPGAAAACQGAQFAVYLVAGQ